MISIVNQQMQKYRSKHCNNLKDPIENSNDVDVIYEIIDEHNPNK